ncbi:DnaT-like ssDNA-binding domain-containing protein [Neptuniibacter marinus]|uniref:DnaT-like ssDNA-binding domain-containing protein n=1 Tax=Neptuniibacter marinus TaxID=1806670 RepID=UPI000830244D|nr:DnaT-like ssDNA-binding domain-containing protein [Neptuniibacter marinus]
MNYSFPETPIVLYPSLIHKVGVEAAVLLTIYQQRLQLENLNNATSEFILSRQQWLLLAPYWDEERLAQLTSLLVAEEYVDVAFSQDGRVRVTFLPVKEDGADSTSDVEMVSRLPVVEERAIAPPQKFTNEDHYVESQSIESQQDTPYYPDAAVSTYQTTSTPNAGPAPTFGGSIGWAKKVRQGDELQALFQQHEQRNKQLHGMELGWQPSENLYALLPRHNISQQFALSCLDEFVLYWLDKDRKETNWDQKFLGWVKREWVKKQTQEGRQQRINNEQKAGLSHEDPRRDTREKRKRVTAAVMDIKDTDW